MNLDRLNNLGYHKTETWKSAYRGIVEIGEKTSITLASFFFVDASTGVIQKRASGSSFYRVVNEIIVLPIIPVVCDGHLFPVTDFSCFDKTLQKKEIINLYFTDGRINSSIQDDSKSHFRVLLPLDTPLRFANTNSFICEPESRNYQEVLEMVKLLMKSMPLETEQMRQKRHSWNFYFDSEIVDLVITR
jgi:hypothetical protein